MKFYSKTHTGKIRQANEDSLLIGEYFAVVADGMGGHNAGDVASSIVVDAINTMFSSKKSTDVTVKEVRKSLSDANKKVWSNAKRNADKKGMGSTATLAVFKEDKVIIGQIGDSRAYLYKEGVLSQITKDHSYVQSLVDAGYISKDEAFSHPQRNIITRAIGTNIEVIPDIFTVDINIGDLILLCSDGLVSCVLDEQIAKILSEGIESSAEKLVDAALDCGGSDNISVVVASVEGDLI